MPEADLRVAVNAVSIAPGGGMVVLLGLLQGWREIDAAIDPTVFASRRAVLDAVTEACPDVSVEPFAEGQGSIAHFYQQQVRLGPLLASRGFDAVLSTNVLVGRCRLPQVVHHQNLKRFQYRSVFGHLVRKQPAETIKDAFARRALRFDHHNAFISDYLRREAEKLVPASAGRNHVVHNGVPGHLVEAAMRPSTDPDASTYHIMAIQGGATHKDNPTLIRCFARVVQEQPDHDWRMTVAGDGAMTRVRQLAEELGVASRITFPGYLSHEELDPLLRRSLCLVFTSVLEGFGNPPLEAMARRCPVVAADCTAIPEVVGNAGLLAPPGDANAFAAAVLRLSSDLKLRQGLIDRGVRRIEQFKWENSARKLARLLHEAVEDHP